MNDLVENILYIPGWIDRAEYNGMKKGIDIWGSQKKESRSFSSEIVMAHSLGCHFAIKNWENNNCKFVLVNPLFPNRSWISWALRWIAYFFQEGIWKFNFKRFLMTKYLLGAIYDSFCILSDHSIEDDLKKIPKERILVIAGKNDKFFCNKCSRDFFKRNNIKIKTIEDMGHDFCFDKIKKELSEFVSS